MRYNDIIKTLIFLTKKNVKKTDIAKALDMSSQAMKARENRNTDFSDKEIKKLSNFFEVDLLKSTLITDECILLPTLGELRAGLGTGKEVLSEETTSFFNLPKSLINKIGASPEHSCIINTDGESMYPTIIGGKDQILIDTSKKEIFDGKIYLIRIDNTLLAKRLQKLPSHKINVISDNPEYHSYIIDLKDESINFDIVGRVMWISRIM